MPYTGNYVRPVLFDKHPAASAVALLAAGKVAADVVLVQRKAGWHSLHYDDQALAVGLTGSYKTDHTLTIQTKRGAHKEHRGCISASVPFEVGLTSRSHRAAGGL